MTDYLPREITPRLQAAMQRLPVVVLSGLRQTGKSTLLSGLRAFLRRVPEGAWGILAYNGARAVRLADRLFALPLGHLLG